MDREKKPHSLRRLVFAFVCISFSAFIVLIFSLFYMILPNLLIQAEDKYIEKQRDVVVGLFNDAVSRTLTTAEDTAVWDETVAFAEGLNPDFVENNWPGVSPLQVYRLNFLIIKDVNGKDVHVEFRDYIRDAPLPEPTGFSNSLSGFSREIMQRYRAGTPQNNTNKPTGAAGVFVYKNIPYLLTAVPIREVRGPGKPKGVLFFGAVLNNAYFQALTHTKSASFEVFATKTQADAALEMSRGQNAVVNIPLPSLSRSPVFLKLSAPRTVYAEGKLIFSKVMLIFLATAAFFTILLYYAVTRLFLRPMEGLDKEISLLSSLDQTSLVKTTGLQSQEFANLRYSINNMVRRLNQSDATLDMLQSILSGTSDMFLYVSDLDTDEILFVSDSMMKHFSIEEPVLGKRCWQVFQPGLTERCPFCPGKRLVKTPGEPVVWEELNPITGRYYRNSDSVITWTDGRLVHLQNRVDITEIKTAETSLKKRLEQQELMSAISQSFISRSDTPTLINNALSMAGRFMDVSRIILARNKAEENHLLFEYEWLNPEQNSASIKGSTESFTPGFAVYDALVAKKAPYVAYTSPEEVDNLEQFARKTKSLIVVPIYANGEFWGILSMDDCAAARACSPSDTQFLKLIGNVISGVLSRSLTEENLVRMSSIVDSSPRYIVYVSPEGRFEYINQGALDILGYSREEMMEGGIDLVLDDQTANQIRTLVIPQVLTEGQAEFELFVTTKSGQQRLLSFSAFTTRLSTVGIGAIATDITEQRKLETEVIAAKEQAESSNRAKSEFLSRMSHEMRTPLNAIIGMTGIAKASPELARKEYCLEKIESASKHLLGVISDILDMSKIEANRFALSPSEFNFEKMLIRVVNVLNFRINERKQNLTVNLDKAVPRFVVADEQRFAQVITNLLSNATKFTPEGGDISLSVTLLREEGDACFLQVAISDNGIGISETNLKKLFRSFEQADGGVARKFEGAGLGLAISKGIVDLMDGTIWASSEEGRGSTFTFTARVSRGAKSSQALLGVGGVRQSLHILVVDGAKETRAFFEDFAKTIGACCDVAASGEEACALLDAHASQQYNIAFVGWNMPKMNGIELTRRIKGKHNATSVVITISPAEWDIIEKEAREAGVDTFIHKPLFTATLIDCINRFLEDEDAIGYEENQGGQTDENFAGKRILLVEDIEMNREVAISLLEHTNIVIDTAENGREAHEAILAAPDKYDLIFMDIHMPEVDGYEATRRIRAIPDKAAQTVPIVAMTANVFQEDVDRCLAAGMNDHIGKPIALEEVLRKLKKYLA